MTSLVALQRGFQRHVDRPDRAMERAVLATPRASAARRLGIYADGYRVRLVEALGTDYPALRGLLEERRFEGLMRDFIAVLPSHERNLRWYGADLPDYLARSPRWRRRPLLAELARFEWALGLAFDARDAIPVNVGEAARLSPAKWPRMRLQLNPSLQLLSLRGNAPQVWKAISAGRKPPVAVMRKRSRDWIVWRKGHDPFYRALPADEAWALAAVGKGRDFGALCRGLQRYAGVERAAQRAAQLLKEWLAECLVCAIN